MGKNKKVNVLRITLCSVFIVIVSFILLVSIDLLFKSFNPSEHFRKEIMNYNSEDKVSYTVSTLANSFYDDGTINSKYVSSIIDYFNVNVSYLFNASKLADYSYSYSAVATVVAEYENDTIYSTQYNLVPIINNDVIHDNVVKINQSFKIDFKSYNDLMKKYKEFLDLDVKAYINVDFRIRVTSDEITDLKAKDNISIRIPLLENITSFVVNQEGYKEDGVYTYEGVMEKNSLFLKLIFLLGTIIALVLDSALLYNIAKFTNRDRYYREMMAVFKVYADTLVEVEEIPEHKKLGEIVITNFKDLVDVSNKLCLPILYKKHYNDYYFFIMTDKYFYKYVISKKIFNKENK